MFETAILAILIIMLIAASVVALTVITFCGMAIASRAVEVQPERQYNPNRVRKAKAKVSKSKSLSGSTAMAPISGEIDIFPKPERNMSEVEAKAREEWADRLISGFPMSADECSMKFGVTPAQAEEWIAKWGKAMKSANSDGSSIFG